MISLRCAILGCGKIVAADGYCSRHREAVLVRGDDPARLRQALQFNGDVQCPAVAQFDGANCCSLIAGHTGKHENIFGVSEATWGTAAQWLSRGLYVQPPAPAPAVSPPSLLPAGLKKRR